MSSEVVVGLASAAVGALAVVASTITAVRSLAVQRESTRLTLQAQRDAVEAQERLLRDRSVEESLRQRRAAVYASVVRWAYDLLAALSSLDEEHQTLPRAAWQLGREAENARAGRVSGRRVAASRLRSVLPPRRRPTRRRRVTLRAARRRPRGRGPRLP
jgi:hypothetical protein